MAIGCMLLCHPSALMAANSFVISICSCLLSNELVHRYVTMASTCFRSIVPLPMVWSGPPSNTSCPGPAWVSPPSSIAILLAHSTHMPSTRTTILAISIASSVTTVLPLPGQRCGTVCLSSFGNRTSVLHSLNDRLNVHILLAGSRHPVARC